MRFASAFAARSFSDAAFARDNPALRSCSSVARAICAADGPWCARGKRAQRREWIVAAAFPVSC